MDGQQQLDGTVPSLSTPRTNDVSLGLSGEQDNNRGSSSSFMSANYARASPAMDQRSNLVLQQPNFGSPALSQQQFPSYGQPQSQNQDLVSTNASNDINPIPNPSNPVNRVQPHPDTPLPPAVQAQFYNRFGAQPPQTHGQLQAFLRHAAQVAHQARVNAQARGGNVANSPVGMSPGAGMPGMPGMSGMPGISTMAQMSNQANSPATSQVGLASTPVTGPMSLMGQNQYSSPGPGPNTASSPNIATVPRSSSNSGHNTPQANTIDVPKTPLTALNSDLGQASGPVQGPGSQASNTPDRRDAGTPSSSMGGIGGLGNRASVGLEVDSSETRDKGSREFTYIRRNIPGS
jgi:hypothetical protein